MYSKQKTFKGYNPPSILQDFYLIELLEVLGKEFQLEALS